MKKKKKKNVINMIILLGIIHMYVKYAEMAIKIAITHNDGGRRFCRRCENLLKKIQNKR